ncbi:DUF6444 domain-containing protein [Streptomyces sp. NPDC001212]
MIDELRAEVAELRAENAELKRRLGMGSTNSSKPPSWDGLEKKATRSQRERSKERRPGGQPGRAGRSLQPVAAPDLRRRHREQHRHRTHRRPRPHALLRTLLWFDHSITGVVAFIAVMSALTILTVGLARETRHTSRPDTAPRRPRDLQKAH